MTPRCARSFLMLIALCAGRAGAQVPEVESTPGSEVVAPDLTEVEAASEEFLAITDNAPLAPEEMPAYWRLMQWARKKSFEELARGPRADVLYTQLRQRPEKYRGQVLRLTLRLRRSLRHDAPANKADVRYVYEAWGCTGESHPYPYLIVFSEPPKNFPLGAKIEAEVDFVGYFLKSMAYDANGKKQAAPLLIGQARWPVQPVAVADASADSTWMRNAILFVAGTVLFVVAAERWRRSRSPRLMSSGPGPRATILPVCSASVGPEENLGSNDDHALDAITVID